MRTSRRSWLEVIEAWHARLKHSKWWSWAAPVMRHPWAVMMATIWVAVIGLVAMASWLLLVPLADWLAHHDVGSTRGPLLQTSRDAARGRLLTLGASLFAAAVLLYTARTFALSRQGQVTDRYARAIEQLGSDKLDVRIGGIYALERIARDSKRDHPTVMDVLTAFVRAHSGEQWPPSEQDNANQENPPRSPRHDVQAALTVIGRRLPFRDIRTPPIDLSNTVLAGANLARARLADANLAGADLTGADLSGADIAGAIFTSAKWPDGEPPPEGWQRDATSGRLTAFTAGTGRQE